LYHNRFYNVVKSGNNEMNLHEYQSKRLFADYGIAVPDGRPARTVDESVSMAKEIGGERWVVKAQVYAGGRGKGGGVKLCDDTTMGLHLFRLLAYVTARCAPYRLRLHSYC